MKWALLLTFVVTSAPIAAQGVQRCGNSTGIVIEAVSSSDTTAPARLLSTRSAVDSTWFFSVAQRTWPLGHMEASVKADWSDASGSGRVCTGVSLSMEQATLTVKGARGSVHFRADLSDLSTRR